MSRAQGNVREISLDGSQRTGTAARRVIDVVVLAAAVALALLVLLPVYGGATAVPAVVGGVVLGGVIVLVARERAWTPLVVAGATTAAYLLLGGALAAPGTTVARVVPTLETLTLLVRGLVQSWKEILTLEPPLGALDALLGVPYVLALAGTVIAGMAATAGGTGFTGWRPVTGLADEHARGGVRRRDAVLVMAAALVPGVLLLLAILLGTVEAPLATLVGLGLVAVLTPWTAWRLRRWHPRRVATLCVMAVVSLGASAVLSPLVAGSEPRAVLRNQVVPPFDLRDQPSPLAAWRHFIKDQRETPLFAAQGLPEGAMVRLATMDAFDGVVWNVAGSAEGHGSGAFRRVGERIPTNVRGAAADVRVEISGLGGIWMPMVGQTTSLSFEGRRSTGQQKAFRFNDQSGAAVLPDGLRDGDVYEAQVVVPRVPSDEELAAASIGSVTLPEPVGVPDSVSEKAAAIASNASSPALLARALETTLSQQGWFSHGIESAGDYPSLSGHGAARVDELLTGTFMVGDGEQYASVMALMARELGLPARVVLGFRQPEGAAGGGAVTFTGDQLEAWVEISFEGFGWVPYFPTPDDTRTPSDDTKPQDSEPQPEVVQPPPPPEEPVVPPKDDVENPDVDSSQEEPVVETDWAMLVITTLAVAIPLLLLVLPPLLIVAAKARRRRRREHAPTALARITGAWDEVLDAAHDQREQASAYATRSESARALEATFPGARVQQLARRADTAVFGWGEPSAAEAAAMWAEVDGAVAVIARRGSAWQRLRARVSLASLRARRAQRRAGGGAVVRGARDRHAGGRRRGRR